MSHFRFNPELLHVRDMFHQKASTAGGGYIICISDGKKIKVPMPAKRCRNFGDAFYTNPVPIKVLFYGDDAITFDKTSKFQEDGIVIEDNVKNFKEHITERNLYYDGRLIYSLEYTVEDTKLTENEFFTHVRIPGFNPALLFSSKTYDFSGYDGIRCNNIVSMPLWDEMLSTLLKFYTPKGANQYVFDAIDEVRSLNLQGLLKLCNMSAKNFGMESIECFELVAYMNEFKTVNLPRLKSKIKTTSPTGVSFSDMVAFHIGKIMKCTSYEQLKAIQQSILYLTSYCIVSNDAFVPANIFKKGKEIKTLPAGSFQTLLIVDGK